MADQNNPQVKVTLTAEDQGVSAAIRQLGQELKNLKKNEEDAAEGALSLSKAFQGLVSIGALLKFEEIGKEAFNAAIDIGKMAEKTGLSTETLSVFHKVAGDAAVSTESVDKGIIKATKSITDFEQGGSKAAKAFATLGITQKDFANLKPDQKLALVTEKLGGLKAGFEKSAAAQAIFSKGGTELIPVMNRLASEGFDKATESTEKLGLLFSQKTVDDFKRAKAAIKELHDAGTGMAAQFEAGLLPSVTVVAEALVETVTDSGKSKDAFKELGKDAGVVVRGLALLFVGLEAIISSVAFSVEDAFSAAFRYIRTNVEADFSAIEQAAHGHFSQAFGTLSQAERNATAILKDEISRQKAIYASLDETLKKDFANLTKTPKDLPDAPPDTPPGGLKDDSAARDAARDDLHRQAELDRIAKAEAALLVKQLENEISIWKAYEKQRETIEKNSYEDGQLTTQEYYRRRQADLKTETEKELEILRAELKATEEEITRAAELRDANTAKAGQFRGKSEAEGRTTEGGKQAASIANDYSAAAAKNEADRLAALGRFNELQTKINTTEIEGKTKSISLSTDERKEAQADRTKILEFEAQLAALQGKRIEKSLAEIEAEAQSKKQELQKAGGLSTEQIDAEIAKWKQLTIAAAEFETVEDQVQQKEKTFEVDRNSFDIARNTIEAQQRAGLLSKSAAEKKINDLIDARLPMLRQEAAAELAAAQAALRLAQATGNQNDVIKAQQQIAAAQNLAAEIDKIGIKTHQLATNIKGALTQDFNTFFTSIITGTKTVGQAFAQLGINIVQSLEEVVAQMLVTIAIEKVFAALGLGPQKANTTKQQQVVAANTAEATSQVFVDAIEYFPFPANLAAAPALAALTESEMGAFTAGATAIGATAAKGAYLDEDTVLQAHAEEMVLPEHLSTGLDYAIRTGSFNPPAALSQPIQNSSSRNYYGGDTYNLQHNGEDALKVLDRELVPRIQRARRRGELK